MLWKRIKELYEQCEECEVCVDLFGYIIIPGLMVGFLLLVAWWTGHLQLP